MSKVYTWMGKGVLSYKGKLYGEGDALPADTPKEILDRGIDNGTIVPMPEMTTDSESDGKDDPALIMAQDAAAVALKEVEKQEKSLAAADTDRKKDNARSRLEEANKAHQQAMDDIEAIEEGDED